MPVHPHRVCTAPPPMINLCRGWTKMPSLKKVLRDGGQPSEENDTIFPQETGC